MTPPPLSLFKEPASRFSRIFKPYSYQAYWQQHLNFIYGQRALLIFTIGFVVFKVNNFFLLQQRPPELFEPNNYFGKLWMPTLPAPELYLIIAALAIVSCLYLFFKPEHYVVRILLTLELLWLNMAQWSYGFLSHVAHLFLLAHLFGIFIPFRFAQDQEEAGIIRKTLNWYYFGLLITYSFSGLWKWLGLFYKLIFRPTEIHWLHPDAALFNAVISLRSYDLNFDLLPLFSYPLFWQVSFLITLVIQTFCIVAAFKPKWQVWAGLALIIFHLVNAIAFATVFVVAPIVLACLFFPYHLLFKNPIQENSKR